MEGELYIFIISSIILSGLFWFLLLTMPVKNLNEIEADAKLRLYKNEMLNHRNDGWLMQHYREKYKERINILLKEKNIKRFWWWFYKLGEKKYV